MSDSTDNHGYHTPSKGTADWHEPLNDNFENLDVDVEIRDVADNRENYDPEAGAKFLETDSGIIYVGDGETWNPQLAMAYYDEHGDLVCGELEACLETETDPDNDGNDSSDFDAPRTWGTNAHAVHQGAIVFGDSTQQVIWSERSNEIRSQMPIYAPTFESTSARAAKTAVEPVDPESVLDGVESLSVRSWEFRDTDGERHIGPMAEDFAGAFESLEGSTRSIASVDADGVALAAIQGLAKRLRRENETLREDLADATAQVRRLAELHDRLEERVDRIESHSPQSGRHADD